ncbi:MAG: rhodanese-like domain-containing protein [Nitrospirota bacterium]
MLVWKKKAITVLSLVIIALSGCESQKEEKTPPVSEEKTPVAHTETTRDFLVSTEELAALSGRENLVIIDARDAEEYNKLHIPGSINIPKETFRKPEDLAYKSEHGFLTSPEKAADVFGNAGIDENTRVIVYGTNTFPNASIPFVILKQYGHDNVRVMQGEIQKWLKERRPLTVEVPSVKPKNFKAVPNPEMAATMDWVMDNAEDIVVIDMRSFEEYTGFDTAGNPRGGHISGAFPVEWKELAGKATVKSRDEMIRALENNGIPLDKKRAYVTYCNWGIGRGTSGFMYLKILGFKNVRVYGGAMEEWSDDPDFPVSTYELGMLE